jgi:hypothetical protein
VGLGGVALVVAGLGVLALQPGRRDL